nr:PHP domain-containing protein [Micromonospora sp. DSM 115978]
MTDSEVTDSDAIDLHTHSTVSDGLLTPTELVQRAGRDGLSVIALTDHDTTSGLAEAAGALPAGLTLLPGAEISCFARVGDRTVIPLHLLAYLFDPSEPAFAAARRRVRESRVDRARRMAEKIAADGHPVSWDQVRGIAGGTVGRPHVAAALMAAG